MGLACLSCTQPRGGPSLPHARSDADKNPLGNPIGGLVFSSAFGKLQQIHEWTVSSPSWAVCSSPNRSQTCNAELHGRRRVLYPCMQGRSQSSRPLSTYLRRYGLCMEHARELRSGLVRRLPRRHRRGTVLPAIFRTKLSLRSLPSSLWVSTAPRPSDRVSLLRRQRMTHLRRLRAAQPLPLATSLHL